MQKPTVYLAGAITGQSYGSATHWRTKAANLLRLRGIETRSPMRGKEFLAGEDDIKMSTYPGALNTPKGIVTRDRNDIAVSDAVLFKVDTDTRISIGTCCEFAMAYEMRKPSIAVVGKGSIYCGHPFFEHLTGYKVFTLEEAVDTISIILD